jgi:serine phosphatase RsbU (regulator of sigma subunit)
MSSALPSDSAFRAPRRILRLPARENARPGLLQRPARAREIQAALLPRDYPIFPGFGVSGQSALSFAHCYRPAEAVGGDFFDIFSLSQSRAGVFGFR